MGVTLDKWDARAGGQFLFLFLNGLSNNTVIWLIRAQSHDTEPPATHSVASSLMRLLTLLSFSLLPLIPHSCFLGVYSSMK